MEGLNNKRQTNNIRIKHVLFYAFLMFLSNYIAFLMSGVVINILIQPIADKMFPILLVICVFAVYILIGLSVPLIAVFFFFRSAVCEQYFPSDDKLLWIKSCIKLILPAEIIRFLVCLRTLGHINTSGFFAPLPTLLFENTYLVWSNRHEQVRQMLQYNFVDFVVYAVCYIIYLAIHLAIVMIIYRHFWLESQKDREDLIIP